MIKTENYIRELYFIIFAQRRVIIWTTIVFFIISVLIAFLWPSVYSASGSILVRAKKAEKSPEAIEDVEKRPFPVTKEDLSSEVQIFTSPDVIERTIKYLQEKNLYKKDVSLIDQVYSNYQQQKSLLKTVLSFSSKIWSAIKTSKEISLVDEVYSIRNNLKTVAIPVSNVIDITYYSNDPKQAVTILGALMDQYLSYRSSVYNPSQAELFYSQQADKFKTELEKNEKNLIELVENTKIADPVKEIEKNTLIKKDLEQQLHILKNDAIEKTLTIKYLAKSLKEKDIQYFSDIENKPVNDFSLKLQELLIERGRLLRAYNEASDKVKLIDKQINELYSLFKNNLTRQLQITNDKIHSIESRINSINAMNVALQKQIVESQRIARESKLQEFSYETFSKRREEAKITSGSPVTNIGGVSILSNAFPSDGPVFPKKKVVIPLGILVGFVTGCSFGFLREFFDHTFKKPSDVYNYTGLPVIFSIPAKESSKSL